MKNLRYIFAVLVLILGGCFSNTTMLPVFAALPDPVVLLAELPAMLRGDYSYDIYFAAQAPDGGNIKSLKAYLSRDQGPFVELPNVVFNKDHFVWRTPKEDIKVAQLRVDAENEIGQIATVTSREFEIRAHGPRLLMDFDGKIYSKANQTLITGSCEGDSFIQVVQSNGEAANFDSVVACKDGKFSVSVSGGNEGSKEFVIRQTDAVGQSTSYSVSWVIDNTPPQIDTYVVNNGDTESITNHLPIKLTAHDERTNVTAFCIKYNQSAPPALSDECWESPQSVDANNVIGPTLEITNYFKRVGYGIGTYNVNSWVRDSAGNISAIASFAVFYKPHLPPTVSAVYASKSEAEGLPPRTDTFITQNQPVNIQWKAGGDVGFDPKISLYYTLDGENYVVIATGLDNSRSGFCAGPTFTNATGCYEWSNPFPNLPNGDGKFFRIRVAAVDSLGSTSFGVSNLINSKNMNLIAGNTELGLGGTATSAIFSPVGNHSLAVHPDGRIYVLDFRGLIEISQTDGVQRLLARTTKVSAINGEVLPDSFATCSTCATLRQPLAIALEFNTSNLLIFDFDRIRRLNTSAKPMTIETVIGGGTSQDQNGSLAPKDLRFTATETEDRVMLAPAPNGDIYFTAEKYRDRPSNGAVLRRYVASEKVVKTIMFSGNANLFGSIGIPTQECSYFRSGFVFDLSNSKMKNFFNLYGATSLKGEGGCEYNNKPEHNYNVSQFQHYAVIDPATYAISTTQGTPPQLAPEYTDKLFWLESNFKFTQGMDGRLYAHGYAPTQNRGTKRIHVYDESTNSWPQLLGQGYGGHCADGATANDACRIEPGSVFVTKQRSIYFLDKNQVRVIQDNGKLLTLAGAPRSTPDNGTVSPLDARFGQLTQIQMYRTNNGTGADRFVVQDFLGFKISEFGETTKVGNVAGDGNEATKTELEGTLTDTAAGKPLTWGVDNPTPYMAVDPIKGDVYTVRIQGREPYRIRRTSGKWEKVNDVLTGGYGPHVQGFSNDKLLIASHDFCFNRAGVTTSGSCDGRLLLYEGSNATKIMGTAGTDAPATGIFCKDQDPRLSCTGAGGNFEFGLSASQFYLDGWLIKRLSSSEEKRIMKVIPGNSKIQQFALLEQNLNGGFAFDTAKKDIYYCSKTQKIYRHRVPDSAEADTLISLPSDKYLCSPNGTMIYAPQRGSIVFDYLLNGQPGVAEYLIP